MPGKPIEKDMCLTKYGQTEMFKFYKNKIKDMDKDSPYNVIMGVFSGVTGDFNKTWMRELIIGKGLILRMPFRLGDVLCKKQKITRPRVNSRLPL